MKAVHSGLGCVQGNLLPFWIRSSSSLSGVWGSHLYEPPRDWGKPQPKCYRSTCFVSQLGTRVDVQTAGIALHIFLIISKVQVHLSQTLWKPLFDSNVFLARRMVSSAAVCKIRQKSQFQLTPNEVPSSVDASTLKRCVFTVSSQEEGNSVLISSNNPLTVRVTVLYANSKATTQCGRCWVPRAHMWHHGPGRGEGYALIRPCSPIQGQPPLFLGQAGKEVWPVTQQK